MNEIKRGRGRPKMTEEQKAVAKQARMMKSVLITAGSYGKDEQLEALSAPVAEEIDECLAAAQADEGKPVNMVAIYNHEEAAPEKLAAFETLIEKNHQGDVIAVKRILKQPLLDQVKNNSAKRSAHMSSFWGDPEGRPEGECAMFVGLGVDANKIATQGDICNAIARIIDKVGMRQLGGTMSFDVPLELAKLNSTPFQDEGGITGLAALTTSHVALHSWPARNTYTLVVYSCRRFDIAPVSEFLEQAFGKHNVSVFTAVGE